MHESAKENLLMRVHAKKLVDSGLVKSTLHVEFSVGITTDIAVYSSQRSYSLEANTHIQPLTVMLIGHFICTLQKMFGGYEEDDNLWQALTHPHSQCQNNGLRHDVLNQLATLPTLEFHCVRTVM